MVLEKIVEAREWLGLAREKYPAPLASIAGELLYEISAARPNSMRCFLLEIDLFEISVAFFSFIQVAQLHKANVSLKASEAGVCQLRDNPQMCTGHWWGLLRETSRDIRELAADVTGIARDLAGLYFDPAGKTARLGLILDQVPGLRNRIKGHSWTLPAGQYERHAGDLLATVANYLACLEWLTNYVLFLCLACEPTGDDCSLDFAALQGDYRRPRRQQVRAAGTFKPGLLYIARKDDLCSGRMDGTAALCLHPFVQVRPRDGLAEDLYLLQGLQRKHAELRGVVGSELVTCIPSRDLARELLDGLLARSTPSAGPFGRLRESMAAVTREALASSQGKASYRADAYYVRPRLLRQVDAFLESDQGLALLAAPSGMGKTALACYLADRWLVSTDETQAVLLVFAHELAAAGESLDHWARRRLGHSLHEVWAAASGAKARVAIIVDGLERARDPMALLEEMLALTQGEPGQAPHFLTTVTESVLPGLLKTIHTPARRAQPPLLVVPPLDAAEGRKLYDMFQGQTADGSPRPPADLFETLSTPLLIRLAHASAHPGGELTVGQVLLSYTEQVVFSDLARTEIVCRLVDRIIESGARTVPTAELARDSWMRSAMLSEGAESPLRALVRDGILFLEWVPPDSRLPVPAEAHIGFTFDQVRDFVIFTRLVRRFGADPQGLERLGASATATSPLIGGLRFFILERLGKSQPAASQDEQVEFLLRLPLVPRLALLNELFAAPVAPSQAQPLRTLLRTLFGRLDSSGREAFFEAARTAFDRLERRGQVQDAGALCDLVVDLGLVSHPQNVLPLLFDWSRLQVHSVNTGSALQTARTALAAAEKLPDPSFRVEAQVCLATALFLQGDRREAGDLVRSLLTHEPLDLLPEAELGLRLYQARMVRDYDAHQVEKAASRARELATLHQRPRWLAQARLAELGKMLSGRGNLRSEEVEAHVEETLRSARQSGYAALEADACRLAAWFWDQDTARELSHVEIGLEAARAARDLSVEAELLARWATWSLRVGRFREAERVGSEAAELFQRLQYRYHALKIRQHVLAICEWELGRPGQALEIWRELLLGLKEMSQWREAALSALLVAEMSCDVGNTPRAQEMLEEARALEHRAHAGHRLNCELVEGRILQIEGEAEGAVNKFRQARAWGVSTRYADFVFQPGILAVRLLLERRDGAGKDLESAHQLLHELVEDQSVDRKQRERYEGEIYLLYALLNLEQGNLEEGRVWLEKANPWFEQNPTHRAAVECRAMNRLFEWVTACSTSSPPAVTDGQTQPKKKRDDSDRAARRAEGIRAGIRRAVQTEVLDVLRVMAATFADPAEAAGYLAQHPALRLLRRHGIEPEEAMPAAG